MKYLFLLLSVICVEAFSQEKVKAFSFISFGDMPYFLPEDYARFDNVIKKINQERPSFSIHLGDIKSSSTPCSNEAFTTTLNYFKQFNQPLIYTPGDNEWTDCNKAEAGNYNPQERLDVIRSMFFKDRKSFGKTTITLTSQSENPQFKKFVENNLWEFNGILFATFHAVGTSNNKLPAEPERMKEFEERDAANLAWLDEVFKRARDTNKPAIVLATQADMFNEKKTQVGFENIIEKLTALSIAFGKPVLLLNGDSHKFLVDKPILREMDQKIKKRRVVENFTRAQVFGEQDMHAVKITVDPQLPGLFRIDQLLVEGN